MSWKDKIKWTDDSKIIAEETLENYKMFLENFEALKDKITLSKYKKLMFDGYNIEWKALKKLIASYITINLNIKKPNVDLLYVATMIVADSKLSETDLPEDIDPNYIDEYSEIEELLNDIESDSTISNTKDEWSEYRRWKKEEADKKTNKQGLFTGYVDSYNAIIKWLDHYPKTKGKIKYNDKSHRVDFNGHIYEDNDVYTIMRYLNKHFIRDYSNKKGLDEAIKGYANENHYNPFKDYIESLQYDDSKDWFEYLLKNVMNAENWDEYGDLYMAEFRKWMYAVIKRTYEPGCKFDNILVLVSENQGTGKSSIFERLFNINNTSYCKIVDASKQIEMGDRFFQQCASSVCVNLDEVAMKSANVNKIKTLLTQTTDEWHKLYAVADAPVYRSFVFAGSTNNTDVLKDYTSMFERRWWFIKITEDTANGIHVNKIFNDKNLNLRDKLWAQAKYNYDNILEENLYISESSDLGKKLLQFQRGYKASNNEQYEEIKNIMDMEWGFFDEKKTVNFTSLVNQYRFGNSLEYCSLRNKEICELETKDNYVLRPEDQKYKYFGKIDRWPARELYYFLEKLGIQFTKQSLVNELRFSADFEYKNSMNYITNKVAKCWLRVEETKIKSFEFYESEGFDENKLFSI